MNFVGIDRGVDRVTAGYLVNVLPNAFTDDLSHNNIAFLRNLDVWCGWESHCGLVREVTWELI